MDKRTILNNLGTSAWRTDVARSEIAIRMACNLAETLDALVSELAQLSKAQDQHSQAIQTAIDQLLKADKPAKGSSNG